MEQTNNNNFYRQVQISRNSDTIRAKWNYGVSARTSFGLTGHCIGCYLPSVGTSCQTEENVRGLSLSRAKTSDQNNHEDGEKLEISPKCDKHHVFNLKKESHEKKTKNKKRKTQTKKKAIPDKKDREIIYVQGCQFIVKNSQF
ncbi:hypothetical protein RclHR1_02710003 [Rhizophagus clarus]|uniref:Uncharacterized protein n=1 Tax=Rhizophagus clarus TaxID=94130 RepID=A0A2Z6RE42_9GLOM|nr:hypothetical protein RclHR1_02710003 [Rhizophagus clarus]